MKVFLSTDFEGTSGIVAWEQAIEGNADYAYGRALLTAEVNAAIEGALAGGATEIVVNDAHHHMRNLRADELAGTATLISGRHKPLYMMQGLDSSFDAIFFISYHGSISAPAAILSHTYSPSAVYEVRIGGHAVGESEINALVAAHYGVPIVLVTGDTATVEEVRSFAPEAVCVVVKDSIGRYAAGNLHPTVARGLIRDGAEQAVRRLAEARAVESRSATNHERIARPPSFDCPARLEMDLLTADMAEMATWIAGVERIAPRTVAMSDDDTLRLYRRFVTILYLLRNLTQ